MGLRIAAFNHLLNQHPEVRADLALHAGRRIAVTLPPFDLAGVVTADGWLAACEGEPEARLRLKHGVALAQLAGREPALADIVLEGDTELATEVGRIVRRLQWDATEDLSRVVGDVAANRVQGFVRGLFGIKGEIGGRLLENWIEHLREEAPLLARKQDVAGFVAAVDELREAADRFDKRLALLEQGQQPG
ncbi:SCP2 domain-containing protein [Vogesella sp. LIG4]|uniref:ubiquinone biosynthesis accessory factor UbiJ n=1 Tax=Vogesella sp. LIG4 TaxID=1192162 RepID=UPI00081FF1A5|nr:sterol-binding protein [Vogesella sp. LIG4]SCK07234.1 ubiquinone biosynthesis protein UbiJ [Vogesella sp. LIG4]